MFRHLNRRSFLKDSMLAASGGALAFSGAAAPAQNAVTPSIPSAEQDLLPKGRIGKLKVSRMLLGGNLLTHYTHSRDLQYVYNLAAHYNTEAKILETLALAEQHGVDTLVIHTVPSNYAILKKHKKQGGKMQYIICPTAPIEGDLAAYRKQVKELVDDGVEAIYLWGVRSDDLVGQGKMDLVAAAVDCAKSLGVPSGVGAHDINVVVECEKHKIPNDFYIKTFHHHNYPSAPKPNELTRIISETPGYWCRDPQQVIEVMAKVEKPWIAFKVMAAGAIPPRNAFRYAFKHGADHVLAGMFDFEIAEDAKLIKEALAATQDRTRPWRS